MAFLTSRSFLLLATSELTEQCTPPFPLPLLWPWHGRRVSGTGPGAAALSCHALPGSPPPPFFFFFFFHSLSEMHLPLHPALTRARLPYIICQFLSYCPIFFLSSSPCPRTCVSEQTYLEPALAPVLHPPCAFLVFLPTLSPGHVLQNKPVWSRPWLCGCIRLFLSSPSCPIRGATDELERSAVEIARLADEELMPESKRVADLSRA